MISNKNVNFLTTYKNQIQRAIEIIYSFEVVVVLLFSCYSIGILIVASPGHFKWEILYSDNFFPKIMIAYQNYLTPVKLLFVFTIVFACLFYKNWRFLYMAFISAILIIMQILIHLALNLQLFYHDSGGMMSFSNYVWWWL